MVAGLCFYKDTIFYTIMFQAKKTFDPKISALPQGTRLHKVCKIDFVYNWNSLKVKKFTG